MEIITQIEQAIAEQRKYLAEADAWLDEIQLGIIDDNVDALRGDIQTMSDLLLEQEALIERAKMIEAIWPHAARAVDCNHQIQ